MKNIYILCFALLALPLDAYVVDYCIRNHQDDVLGEWHTQSRESVIEIYRDGGSYGGKIVWTEHPNDEHGQPKKDMLNPDPAKRNNPFVGTVIMTGFTFDNEETWKDGEIYNILSGKSYKAQITLEDANTLKMRGYLGSPMFGKTVTWKRK